MFRTRSFIFFAVVIFSVITTEAAAITVTPSPSPATEGQNVAIAVNATMTPPPVAALSCTIEVNYGDGSPWTDAAVCTASPCNINTSHIYTKDGAYGITARSKSGSCNAPAVGAPDPGVAILTVNLAAVATTMQVSPSSFMAVRGSAATRNLSYTLTTTPQVNSNVVSTSGAFIAQGQNVGQVNRSVAISLNNGSGGASETVTVPVAVLKRTLALGTNSLLFQRTFTNGANVSATATVPITITATAAGSLRVTGIRLYFNNDRPEITVARNVDALTAYAEIRYDGSGLLNGYWEVDGRLLSRVDTNLLPGGRVIFATPALPPLPAFNLGSHRVRFVISTPAQPAAPPEAIYFVREKSKAMTAPLRLISPVDGATIAAEPVFIWARERRARVYLIEFFASNGGKAVFSAYTREPRYAVPGPVIKKGILAAGGSYRWQVSAFDSENEVIAASGRRTFVLGNRVAWVPGRILVLARDRGARRRIASLSGKYRLRRISDFRLVSVGLAGAILETGGDDVGGMVKRLAAESGVVAAQPEYIFRTMSEPMGNMQNLARVLNFSRLHKSVTGRGVRVAVIDSGVDGDHIELRKRIREKINFLPDPYRAEIHGTAVAGVIAASINNIGVEGVAPAAEIIALRACRQVVPDAAAGECYSSAVARAVDRAIIDRAAVVNMSFGAIIADDLVARLIDAGVEKGIKFVAPAGNSPARTTLAFPASHPAVISVAGTDGDSSPYPNAALAAQADLLAPATNVFTTTPGDGYNFVSGTSFASSAVAGIIALGREAASSALAASLPAFKGDICRWQEKVLGLDRICRGRS